MVVRTKVKIKHAGPDAEADGPESSEAMVSSTPCRTSSFCIGYCDVERNKDVEVKFHSHI